MIPFTEFSKSGDVVHFAHANGYPPECYKTFLNAFSENNKVIGMNARPLWPRESPQLLKNWKLFAKDLAVFFNEQNLKEIIGIGHSMGGVSSLIAAAENPTLFSKLILIDPVIVHPQAYIMSRLPFFLSKRLVPMIKVAMRRRNEWESIEEARLYFKSKKAFSRFQESSFNDFIDHGLKERDGKIVLAYPKEWEARVYSTLTSVWPILKKPPCPLVIIRGQYSNVMNDPTWQLIKNVTLNATFINMNKMGHMMPFERPFHLGQVIKPFIGPNHSHVSAT
ncbi:MAG: alpha/beta hydrolase [Saprospiraceae bacterium]